MADAIHGNTELGSTKQDLIAARVQRELQFAAKLFPIVTDVSQFAVKGAKSIAFPKLGSFTAVDRASGTAGDATVIASTIDTLDLDKKPYVAWIVDPNDEIQSTLNFQLEAAGRAASAHGRRLDNDIITELETVGVATAVAGDITRDIVLDMREQYLENEGLMDMASFVVSVDQEKALLKVDEFTRNDVYGPNSVIRAGQIGTLYGIPVLRHSGLGASTYYLVGKDGICAGFQRQPAMGSQDANEYGVGAQRWAMDTLYGVQGKQLGEKGVLATESPLIIKDAN